MNDFFASLIQHYRARAKTQVFGLFGFWWLIFHFEYFVTLLFVEQNLLYAKTGLLKNEYLNNLYGPTFETEYLLRFIAPFVMTGVTVYIFPKLFINRLYEKEKANEYDRQTIKFKHDKKIEGLRQEVQVRKEATLIKKNQVRNTEKKIERDNPEIVWENEYQELLRSNLRGSFGQLIDSLYEYGGNVIEVGSGYAGKPEFQLDKSVLAYADANGLINYDRNDGLIALTDKGRYFVKQFQAQL